MTKLSLKFSPVFATCTCIHRYRLYCAHLLFAVARAGSHCTKNVQFRWLRFACCGDWQSQNPIQPHDCLTHALLRLRVSKIRCVQCDVGFRYYSPCPPRISTMHMQCDYNFGSNSNGMLMLNRIMFYESVRNNQRDMFRLNPCNGNLRHQTHAPHCHAKVTERFQTISLSNSLSKANTLACHIPSRILSRLQQLFQWLDSPCGSAVCRAWAFLNLTDEQTAPRKFPLARSNQQRHCCRSFLFRLPTRL